MRILVVEDDKKIASFVAKGLKEAGYAVDVAPDGPDGLDLGLSGVYDAAVVDIMLPGYSGLEGFSEMILPHGMGNENLAQGADGALYMVDLATALVLGKQPGSVRRYLFARFCESDRVNLARMRARFTGGDAGAMSGVSPSASAWHRRGRKIKGFWNRLRGKGSE